MPEILVEFVPSFEKLEAAADELASSGVITKEMAALFKQAQKPVDDLALRVTKAAVGVKKDLGSMSQSVKGISKSFQEGFKEGVTETLKEAGVSLKQFNDAIQKTVAVEKTMKQTLMEVTQQMAQLKLEGKENTEQYKELQKQAGLYRDTLKDVSAEINRVGSDTRKLDTVIEFATGVTAAFAIAQGTMALFGEENEELQKTLLKVNAAMSILMGLQQIQNLLQKESNLIMAVSNVQRKLSVVVTNLETAATSKNVIVKGAATIAMKALNAVMKASPAFLLVGVFAAVAGAIAFFTGKTDDAKRSAEQYARELENVRSNLQGIEDVLSDTETIDIKRLELQGAAESKIQNKRIENLKKLRDETTKSLEIQSTIQDGLLLNTSKKGKEALAESFKLENELSEKRARLNSRITAEEVQLQINLKDEREKGAEDQKQLDEKSAEARKKVIQKGFEDYKAGIEAQLVGIEKGTFKEFEIRKKLLKAELQLALNNDELTQNQRLLLVKNFFNDRLELEKQFFRDRDKISFENAANLIQAELAQIGLSFEERERLTIDLLNRQRDLELSQVINNKTKEKEINARFDKEIYEQRAAIRKEALDKELSDIDRDTHIQKSRLQVLSEDSDAEFNLRVEALSELERLELGKIQKKREANQKALAEGAIDLKTFTETSKDLANEEFDVKAKYQKDYTDLSKQESDKRKENFQREVQNIIESVTLVLDVIQSISDTLTQNENTRIDLERSRLEHMRENNMITQKEFEQRVKQVEKAERDAARRQAQREKTLALFEAFVNGAAAIIKASTDPFRLAFTIALVTAQITAIAFRDIPKFGKGTKKAPKGFGEVGETGTELVQTDKGYFVAEHPQVVWFKGGERVYNPSETSAMINEVPQANMTVINNSLNGHSSKEIDYKKLAKELGKEIAKHPKNVVNFDQDGFTMFTQSANARTKYLNKRFTAE